MRMLFCLFVPLLFAFSPVAHAADSAVVDGVRMPVWVERGAVRAPLAAGETLRSGDRVVTGAGGRLLLRAPDGSAIKLGEDATLDLREIAGRGPGGEALRASLEVLKGAFRFTTGAIARLQKRTVSIQVATVTVGIRGTDVWGKGAADRDIVCLIEGEVSVARGAEPAFTMSEPMSFYIAPKDAPALPVAKVSAEQLAIWAAETEIAPGKGGAVRGGKWQVVAARAPSQSEALAVYDRLRAAGFAARIRPVGEGEARVYEVRVPSLPSEREAAALAGRLAAELQIAGATAAR